MVVVALAIVRLLSGEKQKERYEVFKRTGETLFNNHLLTSRGLSAQPTELLLKAAELQIW